MNDKLKGILLTLTGGILWGFSGVCGQYLFQSKNVAPQWLSTWRLFFSGIIILAFAFPKYKKGIFNAFSKSVILPILVFCFISVMGCQYAYFMAIYNSNSATATVLQYIAPAIVLVLTCMMTRKKPSLIQFAALVCAMTGVFFMATGGNIGSLSISAKALFWGLFSGLCYGIYTIQSSSLSVKCSVLVMLGWGNLIGSLPLLVLNSSILFDYSLDFKGILAFAGVVGLGSIVSYGIYIKGCKMAGPVTGSLCACIEPLSSAVISYFWMGTKFKVSDIVGLILITATVIILTLDKDKKADA